MFTIWIICVNFAEPLRRDEVKNRTEQNRKEDKSETVARTLSEGRSTVCFNPSRATYILQHIFDLWPLKSNQFFFKFVPDLKEIPPRGVTETSSSQEWDEQIEKTQCCQLLMTKKKPFNKDKQQLNCMQEKKYRKKDIL